MTTSDLCARVTVESAVATAGLAGLALALFGLEAAGGIAAAGALALGNFWWLTRSVASVTGRGRRGAMALWGLSAGARFLALLVALGALLASDRVHPVGVVAGLAVLPCALVVRGLKAGGPSTEP